MSVTVAYQSSMTIQDIQTADPFANISRNSIQHDGMNKTASLSGTSTPAVSVESMAQYALTSGSYSLDMLALTGIGGDGATVSFTGKKVACLKIQNPSTNANAMTFAPAGSNGYPFLGASCSITLQPGEEVTFLAAGSSGDTTISSTAHLITVTGTGSQVFNFGAAAG